MLIELNRLPRDEQQECLKLPPRRCGFIFHMGYDGICILPLTRS